MNLPIGQILLLIILTILGACSTTPAASLR